MGLKGVIMTMLNESANCTMTFDLQGWTLSPHIKTALAIYSLRNQSKVNQVVQVTDHYLINHKGTRISRMSLCGLGDSGSSRMDVLSSCG